MFLVGNQQHALDDKNRIRLPAKFREQLGNQYILMPGTNGCIFVYAMDEQQRLIKLIQEADSFDPVQAERIRSIAEFSAVVEADAQGRFMLPPDLIEIGAISKAEIWSEERYMARRNGQDHSAAGFDKLYKSLHETLEIK